GTEVNLALLSAPLTPRSRPSPFDQQLFVTWWSLNRSAGMGLLLGTSWEKMSREKTQREPHDRLWNALDAWIVRRRQSHEFDPNKGLHYRNAVVQVALENQFSKPLLDYVRT